MSVIEIKGVKKKPVEYVVYVHDFDDGYHDIDREETELEIKVKSEVRGKYKHINDYTKAISIYWEYMHYLYAKYNGKDRFELLKKTGGVREYIPQKPILRNNKLNRFIIKNNILLSRSKGVSDIPDDIDEYIEKVNAYEKEQTGTELPEFKFIKKSDNYKFDLNDDKESITRKRLNSGLLNRIDRYCYNSYYSENTKPVKVPKEPGLRDIACETKAYKKYIEYYMDNSDTVYNIEGRFIQGDDVEFHTLNKLFSEYGWDAYKIIKNKKGKNNSLVKVLKNNKQRKKELAKKSKKKNKKADAFLDSVVAYGGYDTFEDFQKEYFDLSVNME